MVIVEGVDGTGKTQLVKFLSDRYGFRVVKFSKPKKAPYVEYLEELLNSTDPMIWDRGYLGEACYGPVWRGKNDLEEDWKWKNIEDLLRMRLSFNIYCETDAKEIQRVFETRGEEFTKVEEITPLLDKFEEAIKRSTLKWERLDYRYDKNYETITKKLDRWFEEYQKHSLLIRRLINNRTRGDFYAKNLIFGEIANGDKEKPEFRHIVVPFGNGPSADLLFSVIDGSYAVSNVKKYHRNGEFSDLAADLALPNLKRVICLGQEAEKIVVDSGLWKGKLDRIVHPSYALRKRWSKDTYKTIFEKL